MANVSLTARDIDRIARVVATEVPPGIATTNPNEYGRMVSAVVDTITNRLSTQTYGKTLKDVVDAKRQFSKIAGPPSETPYGTVDNAPPASAMVRDAVNKTLADRIAGVPSEIAGSVNYANPNASSPKNVRGWIGDMINAGALKLGIGRQVHYHGVPPGVQPSTTDYSFSVPGDFMSPVDPSLSRYTETPTPSPRVDPQTLGYQQAAESMTGTGIAGIGGGIGSLSAPFGQIDRTGLAGALTSRRAGTPADVGYAQAQRSLGFANVAGIGGTTPSTYSAPLGQVDRGPLAPAAPRSSTFSNAEQDTAAGYRQAASSLAQATPYGGLAGFGGIKSVPSPQRPDNVEHSMPKGNFSVPGAVLGAPTVSPSQVAKAISDYQYAGLTRARAPLAPVGIPGVAMPTTPVTSPEIAANVLGLPAPATTAAIPSVPSTPPSTIARPALRQPTIVAPQVTRPAFAQPSQIARSVPAPSVSSFTAGDVYSGRAPMGVPGMASTGESVTRNSDGTTSIHNNFGATTVSDPSGHSMASLGGFGTGIGSALGKAAPGMIGGMLGTLAGGPVAGVLGSMAARSAMGQPAMGGLLGAMFGGSTAGKSSASSSSKSGKSGRSSGGKSSPGDRSGSSYH